MGDWFSEKVHGLSLDDIINMDWSRGGHGLYRFL